MARSKEDNASRFRDYFEDNKEKVRANNRRKNQSYRKRNQDYITGHLKNNPCVDCGTDDVRVLEFDHVRGEKHNNVSRMANNSLSIEKIAKEIAKCDVRCANCHRIKTYETIWSDSPKNYHNHDKLRAV